MTKENIQLKTKQDIKKIAEACGIISSLFRELKEIIVPGVTGKEVEQYCNKYIEKKGGRSALFGFKGFPSAICFSVNHVAVHGIPKNQDLVKDDIVTIDITVEKDGFYGDGAWTYILDKQDPVKRKLIQAAWQSSISGISKCKAKGFLGDIGSAIEKTAQRFGVHIIQDLVGHGVGFAVHEDPQVPHFGLEGSGRPIVPGMVLTIEPVVTFGSGKTKTRNDNWTVYTADYQPTAQYEHTIAVQSKGIRVLTISEINLQNHIDFPPFF
ncbi:MAG: type I methionyl aminopeptidase [Spirochaetia bacterium]